MPYPYRTLREWILEEEKLGQAVRIQPPIKCGDYNNLVDIGNTVPGKQPQTEARALVRYLHSLPGKPIGIIEKPVNNRPDIPVVQNMWPGRERVLRGMGSKTKDEFSRKLETILDHRIKPKVVPKGQALCKQVVIPESEIDLRKNIPRCWTEFTQWCWTGANGTVIVRDPATNTHGLSKARTGTFDWKDGDPGNPYPAERIKRDFLCTVSSARGFISSTFGNYYATNYGEKGKPMAAAWAYGVPTDVHVIASLKSLRWPQTGDEYEILGGFRGEPVEVVESETIPGLMVPAHAEWIIEGEFIPERERIPRYGLDVYRGNLHGGHVRPVFRVKCITHRKDPWWTAASFSSTGMNGHDGNHIGLYIVTLEAAKINYLRRMGFLVKDVVSTNPDMHVEVIQLDVDGTNKPFPHYGKKVGMALTCAPDLRIWAKYIIVVGPDVDPYDLHDVLWAVGTRTQPVADMVVTAPAGASWGDPRSQHAEEVQELNLLYGQQVVIDALIKTPERYDSWPPRSEPSAWEADAIKIMQQKLHLAR